MLYYIILIKNIIWENVYGVTRKHAIRTVMQYIIILVFYDFDF